MRGAGHRPGRQRGGAARQAGDAEAVVRPCGLRRPSSRIARERDVSRWSLLRPGALEHAPAGPRTAARRGTPRSPRGRCSPSPGSAWRSTLEPSGVCESLKCSEPRRSRPTIESKSSTTVGEASRRCARRSPRPAGGRSRGRRRAACRRRPARSGSRAPRTSGRACPPAPAVSSRCSAQCSDSASASAIVSEARVIASSTGPPSFSAEPGCSTTPSAPERVAGPQRGGQRGQRLVADLRVLGGAVEEVDGVDQRPRRRPIASIASWNAATSSSE